MSNPGKTSVLEKKLLRRPVMSSTSPAKNHSCTEIVSDVRCSFLASLSQTHRLGMTLTEGRRSSCHSPGYVATVQEKISTARVAIMPSANPSDGLERRTVSRPDRILRHNHHTTKRSHRSATR